jgi:hypothetical protein
MRDRGFERFAPLAGVVFLVLAIISFALEGSSPDSNDSTAKVVRYWSQHDSRNIASAIIIVFAALFLVWFGATLRTAIWRAEGGSGRLAAIAFAATVITATGILVSASLQLAIADTVGDISADGTHTLSALYADFFLPFVGGLLLLNVATAIAILKCRVLPRWLGWVIVLIVIVGVTPVGFIAFIATVVWIGVAGVILFVRGAHEPSAPPPPSGMHPAS